MRNILNNKGANWCHMHQREFTGFSTLYCPNCEREKDTEPTLKGAVNVPVTTSRTFHHAGHACIPPTEYAAWEHVGQINNYDPMKCHLLIELLKSKILGLGDYAMVSTSEPRIYTARYIDVNSVKISPSGYPARVPYVFIHHSGSMKGYS